MFCLGAQSTGSVCRINCFGRVYTLFQSQNAQLQQHCYTTSHSSCLNCPPSAAAHARSMEKYVIYGDKTRAMSLTR